MAKWGEGDPRWIVEERPDATNVNNWHWTEKNASPWSKDKLKELFTNLKIDDDIGVVEIIEMSKCEGEAVANNRKAKLIFFYEWVLTLKWKGKVNGSDEEVTGKIEIPNLSEEHEPKDVDVSITVKEQSTEAEILKEMMRAKGCEIIRQKLKDYIDGLKIEFSQGMILPTKDADSKQTNSINTNVTDKSPVDSTVLNNAKNKQNAKSKAGSVKLETEDLNMSEKFKCTAEDFYRAFTIKEMVQAFSQGPCVLEAEKNGKFSLLGGNITGTFTELVPNEKIVQNWRFKTWPEGHFANVIINITQNEDNTVVRLKATNIPKSELECTKEGWRRYYWESMRRTFGFGSILY